MRLSHSFVLPLALVNASRGSFSSVSVERLSSRITGGGHCHGAGGGALVVPSASAGGTERGCVHARLGDSTCRRATRSLLGL